MSYSDRAQQHGKLPLTLIEIDLDLVTSSTAAWNPNGSPCFNTPTTSRGFEPLTIGIRTVRFLSQSAPLMLGLDAVPSLLKVAITDDRLTLGEGLGEYGKATITLRDHQDDDRVEDPYYIQRPVWLGSGSFWRRLLARHPYFTGRAIRVLEGFWSPVFERADFRQRHYLIKELAGPSLTGEIRITAVGPLQQTELSRAEAPHAAKWRLTNDCGPTDTSLDLIGREAEDPAQGTLRLGDELMDFTIVGTTCQVTNRGKYDTAVASHKTNDGAQPCLVFTDATPDEILATLLIEHGGVPAAMIPTAVWQTVRQRWLGVWRTTWVVAQPTKVMDLVREVCRDAGLFLWYDALSGLIQLQALRPVADAAIHDLTDDDLLEPIAREADLAQRVSRADVQFGLRTPTEDPDKPASYRTRWVPKPIGEDATAWREPARKVYRSRLIPADRLPLAQRLALTIQGQLQDGRLTYHLLVTVATAEDIPLGDVVRLTSRDLLGPDGQPLPTLAQVVAKTDEKPGHSVRLTCERYQYGGVRWAYASPAGSPTYPHASPSQRDPAAYAAGSDGRMANGDPGYAAQ